jgi:hypothetical protein
LPSVSILDLHSISRDGKRSKIRTNIGRRCFLGFAANLCRRAYRARARSRRRALGGRRALDLRATRTRAGRAFTRLILARTTINDDRLRLGDAALEHILAKVRNRRALRLQHVLAEIGHLRAGRNCALQHILAEIGFTARRACDASLCTTAARILLTTTRATC